VLVIATLGATRRSARRLGRRTKQSEAPSEPDPTPVETGRATVVDVGARLADQHEAAAWLKRAGEERLAEDLAVLNRALYSFRLATADPYLNPVERGQALVARIGYGLGEEVAEGLWTDARELVVLGPRQRRSRILQPQAQVAALLSGRDRPLASEELALRARLDLDHGRRREAALQLLVALDAAIAELATDEHAEALADRVDELRGQRDPAAQAAQAALEGALEARQVEAVEFALGRVEAALRARVVEAR
jgi:hypothetical protein